MLSCPQCGRHYAQGITLCPEDGTVLRADETVMDFVVRDPLVGQVLDEKYRLDERLGEGGMGTVYRATHLLIDRPVALKVLHTRFVEDEAAQHRFRREARAAGRLQHPNAVAVTDFGSTPDGYVYLVMELLEGQTLRDVLAEEAPLPTERAVALMLQIAAAVEAAHEAGVIHRDLKPGNIFVVRRKNLPPVVKVLDFGIAKLAAESLDDSDARNLTQTGVMIGTPRYMSPEQCDGDTLTPASDVYSLGIIFYEMLTGETPFNGATPLAVALQHSAKQPRPPRELMPSLPPELERVVLHALAKKPAARPRDAGAFREELLETARRIGLTGVTAAFDLDAGLSGDAADSRNGQRDKGNGQRGDAQRDAANVERAEAKTPSGRLVIDLDGGRNASVNDLRRASRSGDTTVLASSTAEQARATGAFAAVATTTADEISHAHPRAFTRFRIMLDRRGSLRRLRRAPVLVALAVALLAIVAVTASVVVKRRANSQDANAAVAASPSPTPEATPQASPSPDESANTRGAQEKGKRDARATRNAKRTPKGNVVTRTLKKIFKNPF